MEEEVSGGSDKEVEKEGVSGSVVTVVWWKWVTRRRRRWKGRHGGRG